MKKFIDSLYWKISFFLVKISIPTFIIGYLGIYPMFGNKVYARWSVYEFSELQCWIHISIGIFIIVYSFDFFEKIRIREIEKLWNYSDVEENINHTKRNVPLKKDPIEQLWEEEKQELISKKAQNKKE